MSDKKFRELKIDEELRDLLPPLTEDEYKQLEENVKQDGCTNPIVTWNGYIVDGHNRYNICRKLNYGFNEFILAEKTKDDVIEWMINTQLGRRNLTPIQRISIAEKYREVIKKKARERQLSTLKQNITDVPISAPRDKHNKTRDELAKIAGVGHDTYEKGKKILESDNEEIKQKVKSGEIKINKAYNELFPKNKKEEKEADNTGECIKIEDVKEINKIKYKICSNCGQEKKLDYFYIGHNICKECEQNEGVEKQKQVTIGSGVFKDISGKPLSVSEEYNCSKEEFDKLVKDVKTPKNIEDYSNPVAEIDAIKNDCDDLILDIEDRLFNIEKVFYKMNCENINELNVVLDMFVNKLNKLKNKINNEKVGR